MAPHRHAARQTRVLTTLAHQLTASHCRHRPTHPYQVRDDTQLVLTLTLPPLLLLLLLLPLLLLLLLLLLLPLLLLLLLLLSYRGREAEVGRQHLALGASELDVRGREAGLDQGRLQDVVGGLGLGLGLGWRGEARLDQGRLR